MCLGHIAPYSAAALGAFELSSRKINQFLTTHGMSEARGEAVLMGSLPHKLIWSYVLPKVCLPVSMFVHTHRSIFAPTVLEFSSTFVPLYTEINSTFESS